MAKLSLTSFLIMEAVDQRNRDEEKIIRRLLEQWVSELEPSVVRQTRHPEVGEEIVGLTAEGHDKVVVWRE